MAETKQIFNRNIPANAVEVASRIKEVLYTKKYADGMVYFLEEVRDNRKSLSFQTIYKKKNAG